MGSYENSVDERTTVELELERFGVDDYQIEVTDEKTLSYIASAVSTIGELLRGSSGKIASFKAVELSRRNRSKQRLSLLFNVEVPRSPQASTIIKGGRRIPGKQLELDAGGVETAEEPGVKKSRKIRLPGED